MNYQTKTETIRIGARDFHIRSLLDINQGPQESNDQNSNSNNEVNETNWPIFGQIWPAGCFLAEVIDQMDLTGLRILEVGCGLALAGIVAHSKGADVIASDFHPAAEEFLNHNAAINQLPPITYHEGNWAKLYPDLGLFDLIIGSDILYDRDHPKMLANFVVRHLKPESRMLLTDPGRQNYRKFTKEMESHGFTCTSTLATYNRSGELSAKYHLLEYRRARPLAAP